MFLLQSLLHEIEPNSTFRYSSDKNQQQKKTNKQTKTQQQQKQIARHVNFMQSYTWQQFVQLVSQQRCETGCKKNCLVYERPKEALEGFFINAVFGYKSCRRIISYHGNGLLHKKDF